MHDVQRGEEAARLQWDRPLSCFVAVCDPKLAQHGYVGGVAVQRIVHRSVAYGAVYPCTVLGIVAWPTSGLSAVRMHDACTMA